MWGGMTSPIDEILDLEARSAGLFCWLAWAKSGLTGLTIPEKMERGVGGCGLLASTTGLPGSGDFARRVEKLGDGCACPDGGTDDVDGCTGDSISRDGCWNIDNSLAFWSVAADSRRSKLGCAAGTTGERIGEIGAWTGEDWLPNKANKGFGALPSAGTGDGFCWGRFKICGLNVAGGAGPFGIVLGLPVLLPCGRLIGLGFIVLSCPSVCCGMDILCSVILRGAGEVPRE
jgi:hypothetical protein